MSELIKCFRCSKRSKELYAIVAICGVYCYDCNVLLTHDFKIETINYNKDIYKYEVIESKVFNDIEDVINYGISEKSILNHLKGEKKIKNTCITPIKKKEPIFSEYKWVKG